MARWWSRGLSAAGSGARRLVKAAPGVLCDLIGFAGVSSISYGAWRVYEPAGFIVAGLLLMAFAMLVGRRLDARKS